jgi:hypothetical protein
MERAIYEIITSLSRELCFENKDTGLSWGELRHFGIHFNVEVRCENNGYERDGSTRHEDWERRFFTYLHFVNVYPHRVYMARTPERDLRELNPADFRNIGNHDTCWKDSLRNELSKVYFEATSYCWDHVPKPHQRAPIESNLWMSIVPLFLKPFRFVWVDRQQMKDYENSNSGYFDELKSIALLEWKTAIDFAHPQLVCK